MKSDIVCYSVRCDLFYPFSRNLNTAAIEKELQYSTRYTKENAGKVGCGSDHLFG